MSGLVAVVATITIVTIKLLAGSTDKFIATIKMLLLIG